MVFLFPWHYYLLVTHSSSPILLTHHSLNSSTLLAAHTTLPLWLEPTRLPHSAHHFITTHSTLHSTPLLSPPYTHSTLHRLSVPSSPSRMTLTLFYQHWLQWRVSAWGAALTAVASVSVRCSTDCSSVYQREAQHWLHWRVRCSVTASRGKQWIYDCCQSVLSISPVSQSISLSTSTDWSGI